MSRLKYVRHCLCNALYVYCRGRAVNNVGKTCGPTPCFVLAINTFKLNSGILGILSMASWDMGIQGFLNFWDICHVYFRDMGYFPKDLKGYVILPHPPPPSRVSNVPERSLDYSFCLFSCL